MTTPEANPADIAEQADVMEQDDDATPAVELPLEAAEADVAEQAVAVEQDDEYR